MAYLGSPAPAVPFLEALLDRDHEVVLAVTQPDRRRGRGGALVPTPVKAAATARGVPTTDQIDDLLSLDIELGVVVAFGRLIKPHVLQRVPMVNVHFSLLPRWRGAAPVERAILAGDAETGVCLMQLEEGLDTGPVYAVERVTIGPDETADSLRNRLVAVGVRLLVEGLDNGLGVPHPQEGDATYAEKIRPEERELAWSQPADQLHRVVRIGGAWTTFRGKRLRVLEARVTPAGPLAPGVLQGLVVGTGDGGLELVEVQAEGRSPRPAAAWHNGARPTAGERLGT